MGNAVSIVNEQVQPLLAKVSNLTALENVRKRDVISAILVAYGVYIGGSFIAKCYKIHRFRQKLEGIPNKPSVVMGNLSDFPGPGPEVFGWVQGKVNQYKKFYQFWVGPFSPMISLCHPETSQNHPEVIRTKVHLHRIWPVMLLLKEWLGDGLLLSSGSKWFRNRRLLTPAFHFRDSQTILRDLQSFSLTNSLTKCPLKEKMAKRVCPFILLSVFWRWILFYDVRSQMKRTYKFKGKMTHMWLQLLRSRTLLYKGFSILSCTIRYYFTLAPLDVRIEERCSVYTKYHKKYYRNERSLWLRTQMHLKRDILISWTSFWLLEMRTEKVCLDREIRDEVDTFMFEGHDTTASGISWILYELSGHPEVQEQAGQEVIRVIGSQSDGTIEWSDLSRLPYLSQCIKEAMRVHPPVPFIGRQLSQDIIINGCTIPKDTICEVSIYGVHHNPEVWGKDHMEFKPERFHPDNMKDKDAFDYIPFSAGSRNCIGQNFALNEEKVVIRQGFAEVRITSGS
uniref:CYP342A1 n=1 Tax=Alitta virens TaxID=880429 RepID=Q6SPQ5_ALIVI|nr:CYP342A1 [Alitta virens]